MSIFKRLWKSVKLRVTNFVSKLFKTKKEKRRKVPAENTRHPQVAVIEQVSNARHNVIKSTFTQRPQMAMEEALHRSRRQYGVLSQPNASTSKDYAQHLITRKNIEYPQMSVDNEVKLDDLPKAQHAVLIDSNTEEHDEPLELMGKQAAEPALAQLDESLSPALKKAMEPKKVDWDKEDARRTITRTNIENPQRVVDNKVMIDDLPKAQHAVLIDSNTEEHDEPLELMGKQVAEPALAQLDESLSPALKKAMEPKKIDWDEDELDEELDKYDAEEEPNNTQTQMKEGMTQIRVKHESEENKRDLSNGM
jgi:hypothetical protein